jgi:hypothetical protein
MKRLFSSSAHAPPPSSANSLANTRRGGRGVVRWGRTLASPPSCSPTSLLHFCLGLHPPLCPSPPLGDASVPTPHPHPPPPLRVTTTPQRSTTQHNLSAPHSPFYHHHRPAIVIGATELAAGSPEPGLTRAFANDKARIQAVLWCVFLVLKKVCCWNL